MTDILTYIAADIVRSQSSHLETSDGLPLYQSIRDGQIWLIKGKAGFPWDMHTFDDNFVYQSITEQSWTDPKQFKMWASKDNPKANGGILWLPRQFDENGGRVTLLTQDTSYRTYSECGKFTTATLGGPAYVEVEYVLGLDFGGDLGKHEALKQSYYWRATREVNYYVTGFGLVQWVLYQWANGTWSMAQTSLYNLIKPGGVPNLQFPCGVPTI